MISLISWEWTEDTSATVVVRFDGRSAVEPVGEAARRGRGNSCASALELSVTKGANRLEHQYTVSGVGGIERRRRGPRECNRERATIRV